MPSPATIPNSAEIAAALAIRQRYLNGLNRHLTREERWAKFTALQTACFARLHASPEAWHQFQERNLRNRVARPNDPRLPHP
ncbi:MAG: hypothetical protein WCH61_07840 [bacterium]